jgi:L-alanine-DL-glutamate epimerase-like enolase superfamily enzyme
MNSLQAPIAWLETRRIVVPLAERISAPGLDVAEREFVMVRIGAGGKTGTGYGLTRGAQLDRLIMHHLAAGVLGRPAGSIRAIWDAARRSVAMLGECGIFARSLSLVDIALWDLHGQLLAAPLWRLLGGHHSLIPCWAITGYYRRDDPVGAVRRDAEALLAAGYRAFKLPIGLDRDLDVRRVAALRAVVGPGARVAVDAAGAYRSTKDALAEWRWLEGFGVEFLEDPFPATAWRQAARLAQRAPFKVAFGESVVAPENLARLGTDEGVDILRLDATVHLGVTGFMMFANMALETGRSVFPHYYPDLHAILAAALGGIEIEESDPLADTVGFHRLRRASGPPITDGAWQVGEDPGFGMAWDEDALDHYTVERERVEAAP